LALWPEGEGEVVDEDPDGQACIQKFGVVAKSKREAQSLIHQKSITVGLCKAKSNQIRSIVLLGLYTAQRSLTHLGKHGKNEKPGRFFDACFLYWEVIYVCVWWWYVFRGRGGGDRKRLAPVGIGYFPSKAS
jgi:hypothetical protein